MADSLCGPSNALQNFQKHTTLDRTLQQDRLISRSSPSQGFRSSPGPNASLSESDFQAFQAGNLPPESQQGFHPTFSHAPPLQLGPAAWASDFKLMHISSPAPQFAEQRPHYAMQPRHDTGGWHQDFARQLGAEQQTIAQSSQMTASPAYGYSPMNGGLGMGMQSQFPGSIMGHQAEQAMLHPHPVESFDEEAFARAFEEAAKEEQTTIGVEIGQDHDMGMSENAEASKSAMELGQEIMLDKSAERFMSSSDTQIPDQARIGADLIHDPTSESQDHFEPEDPDALARTAGELLNSVRSNQSEKFQNSEFLGLMRQLRNREVIVKGENIVETNNGGAYKNEINDLFWSLRKAVFSENRPLASHSSEQVRSVLTTLLQLNDSISSGLKISNTYSYWRVHRLLKAVINGPDLASLPALRNLAQFTLLNFETVEKGRSNIAPSPFSSELDAIRTANEEIICILPPTETAVETLIYNYISDSLQVGFSQEPLNRLIGYAFRDRHDNQPYSTSTHSPHIQRAREIMGPAVSETMESCRGIWCPLLSVENFFDLVSAHQHYGGVKSAGFKKLLREIERSIEEGVTARIRRTREGFRHRFGVETSGLERPGEGEGKGMPYEDQLLSLEAEDRLRLMEAHREQRRLDDSGGGK